MTDKTNLYLPDAEILGWWHEINDALLAMDPSWGLPNNEASKSFGRWKKHQAVLDLLRKGLELMREKPKPTDAEHEAKIRAWRQEATSLIPNSSHVDRPLLRVLHVAEINDICDIARRAPDPKPKPEPLPTDAEREAKIHEWREVAMATKPLPHHVGYPGMRVLYTHEIDAICDIARRAPKPEPRPSSGLLEAAKKAADQWHAWKPGSPMDLLRKAIAAEEARGPSEVYPQFCDSCSDSIYDDEGELIRNPRIDELRKERSEAIGRAKTAERERDEAWGRAAKAETEREQLLVVNAELRHDHDDAIDYMQQADELRQQLAEAQAALSTPPQQNHASNDKPLREWLETYDPDGGILTTIKQDEAAFAELVRRALAVGAK